MQPRPLTTHRAWRGLLGLTLSLLAGWCAPQAHAQTAAAGAYRPETLTVEQIESAIERAVAAVYDPKDDKLQPRYTPLPEYFFHSSRFHVNQEIRNMMGNNALICWALLACGESYQNPDIYKRLNWVLSSDQPQTYGRAMRLQMLAELPRSRWAPWVHRDSVWLTAAMTDQGNFDDDYFGKPVTGWGDNANGQYGVLGLWGAARSGYPIKAELWKAVENYWTAAQQPVKGDNTPAGWAVYSFAAKTSNNQNENTFNRRISGPMTAGGVAVLGLAERYLRGPRMTAVGEQHLSESLRRGLRYLDQNFSLADKAEESDPYYYYWTMQRVVQASGYRSFNGVDIFRDVTAKMLNEQDAKGTWTGPKGRLLATAFALLYLSRAYDPIAISKLRWSVGPDKTAGPWNNRPHDLWNFADYISDLYEYTSSWQIAEVDLPAYSLIESPLLWLATHEGFNFSAQQLKNLREYLDAGGMLLINPDKITPEVGQSVTKLVEALYPGAKMERVKPDHDFYSLHQKLRAPVPMQMVDNGIRPLILYFQRDLGEGLQENDVVTGDSFRLLSNIYLYAVGLNYRRARLVNNLVPLLQPNASRQIAGARIKHTGNYDPEPGAMTQLHNLLANEHGVNFKVEAVAGAGLTSAQRIAFLSTTGDGVLEPADAAAIRKWVEAGGLLVVDAAGGSSDAARNAEVMLNAVFPDAPKAPLSTEAPLITGDRLPKGYDCRYVRFRNFALKSMGPVNRPRLQAVMVGDRVGALLSNEDLTCGLAGLDHWRIFGYTPQTSRELVINAVLNAAMIR